MKRLPLVLSIALSSALLAGVAAAQEPPAASPPRPAYAPRPYYAPPYPYPPPYPYVRETERYSTAMMITGIVASSVGSIALGIGTTVYVINDSVFCDAGFGGGGGCGPQHGADTAVMVIGGIAMLAGIPLIAIGVRQVPAKTNEAALAPKLSASPRGAALSFSF